MIRLTLRQHRTQLGAGLAGFAALALMLAWTEHEMTAYLHTNGLSGCLAHGGGCDAISRLFENRYGKLLGNSAYLNFLPMLIGVFWGAPLVARELEQGTHRLAWTQSVSRARWLLTKLGLFVVASIVAAALFSLLLAWWFPSLRPAQLRRRLLPHGPQRLRLPRVVPIAYTLYAFALGTTAGVLIRRTVPAMAVTLGGFLPVRLRLQTMRAHFMTPLRITYPASATSPRYGRATGC